jgi:superfamily II DNA or RNA helicase
VTPSATTNASQQANPPSPSAATSTTLTTVCDAFNAAGIRAATLLGNTTDRDALVARFAAGELQVLVTVDVVSEGFDCPGAAVAILLRPTQSEGLYLQQVGRVLRPAPGKAAAIILDHVGNVHRHGFPDDHRDWTLARCPPTHAARAARQRHRAHML